MRQWIGKDWGVSESDFCCTLIFEYGMVSYVDWYGIANYAL